MQVGDKRVVKCYLGGSELGKVYLGERLMWSKGRLPQIVKFVSDPVHIPLSESSPPNVKLSWDVTGAFGRGSTQDPNVGIGVFRDGVLVAYVNDKSTTFDIEGTDSSGVRNRQTGVYEGKAYSRWTYAGGDFEAIRNFSKSDSPHLPDWWPITERGSSGIVPGSIRAEEVLIRKVDNVWGLRVFWKAEFTALPPVRAAGEYPVDVNEITREGYVVDMGIKDTGGTHWFQLAPEPRTLLSQSVLRAIVGRGTNALRGIPFRLRYNGVGMPPLGRVEVPAPSGDVDFSVVAVNNEGKVEHTDRFYRTVPPSCTLRLPYRGQSLAGLVVLEKWDVDGSLTCHPFDPSRAPRPAACWSGPTSAAPLAPCCWVCLRSSSAPAT